METRFDSSALDALPIFPLPDVVLFPGALMPLHVFEPRYREMIADVVRGRKLLGVVRLRPGYEDDYEGRPPVYATGGVGFVIAHEPLPDGRSNILLRGVGRIEIQEEHAPTRAYRLVRARLVVERSLLPHEVLERSHEQLVAVCDRLAGVLPEGGEMLRDLVRSVSSPSLCADVIAAAVVIDPDERQALLETADPAKRLDRVMEQASRLLSRFRTGKNEAPN
jgi:Lon protease-like protein